MGHASGLASGFLEPKNLITQHYTARNVLNYETTLVEMMDILAALPLIFIPVRPGDIPAPRSFWAAWWKTSVGNPSINSCAGEFFEPLGMRDTGFFVPPESHDRLAVFYCGADLLDPMKGG